MSILFHLYTHYPSHTCKERLFFSFLCVHTHTNTHSHPLSGLPSVLTSQAVLAPLRPGTQSMAVPLLSVSLGLTNTLMHKATPTLTFISHIHEVADSRLNVRAENRKHHNFLFLFSCNTRVFVGVPSNFACSLYVTTEVSFSPSSPTIPDMISDVLGHYCTVYCHPEAVISVCW